MTRGERNNNPLNIRRVVGTNWRGEIVSPLWDKDFVQFSSLEYGIRAAFCILETYRRKHQAVCIEDIINRWAPPTENNTTAYVNAVCKQTGIGGKERLEPCQWTKLVQAMAIVESGMHLSEELIQRSYQLFQKLKK